MLKSLKPGDRVQWEPSQGAVTGEVQEKLAKPTKIKSRNVAASPANPDFLVESEKTGAQAAHEADGVKNAAKKNGSRR